MNSQEKDQIWSMRLRVLLLSLQQLEQEVRARLKMADEQTTAAAQAQIMNQLQEK